MTDLEEYVDVVLSEHKNVGSEIYSICGMVKHSNTMEHIKGLNVSFPP